MVMGWKVCQHGEALFLPHMGGVIQMQVLVFSSLHYGFQTWPEGDTLFGCVGCSDLNGCLLGRLASHALWWEHSIQVDKEISFEQVPP